MSRVLGKLFLLAGVVALLAACSSSPSPVQPPAPLTLIKNPETVQRIWSLQAGHGVAGNYLRLAPVVVDGRGYVSDARGRLEAFDVKTGKRLWQVDLAVPVTGGVGYAQGRLLLGTRRGVVLAVSPDNGKVLWRAQVSSEVLAPPAGADGNVVVRTIDGKLFALNADDGQQRWSYDRGVPVLTLRGTSAPVIHNGIVISGFDDGRLSALTLNDGTVLWETAVAIPSGRTELERMVDIDGTPVVVGDVVYVASYHGRVAAIQIDSGRMLWARDISSYVGLAVDDKKVYVSEADGQVWALDRFSGATLWKQDKLARRYLTAPALYRNTVVVGDYAGYVHFLSLGDGHLVARVRINGADDVFNELEPVIDEDSFKQARNVLTRPIVADDELIAMDRTGKMDAFRLGAR